VTKGKGDRLPYGKIEEEGENNDQRKVLQKV
jgi:hypothetical protein